MHRYDTDALRKLFATPRRIAILMHQRPDGDAMGSVLGLTHYLKKRGHIVCPISPTDIAPNLRWIPGTEDVRIGERETEELATEIQRADAVFCLDLNAPQRVAPLDEAVRQHAGPRVVIDHHLDPDDFAELFFWDDAASSTCEMVYRLIDGLNDRDQIDETIATCLYTGILTDTGSFRFPATTPEVHRIVADLLERGASPNAIYESIFSNNEEKRLRLTGFVLSERLTVLSDHRTAYLTLSREDVDRFSLGPGDTEGLVNYPLSIRGVNLAVIMIEYPDKIKMSFRSRGSFPANELAGHFNGGGHLNAAGGRSQDSLADTEQKFRELLESYSPQLQFS